MFVKLWYDENKRRKETIIKKNYNSKFVLVPPGQTGYLQPLDTSINKSIKQFMKQEDNDFQIIFIEISKCVVARSNTSKVIIKISISIRSKPYIS